MLTKMAAIFTANPIGPNDGEVIKSSGSAANVPTVSSQTPPGNLGTLITNMLGWLLWGAILAGVAGLIICGIMMIMGRRGRSQTAVEGAIGIPWVMAGLLVAVLASTIVKAVVKV